MSNPKQMSAFPRPALPFFEIIKPVTEVLALLHWECNAAHVERAFIQQKRILKLIIGPSIVTNRFFSKVWNKELKAESREESITTGTANKLINFLLSKQPASSSNNKSNRTYHIQFQNVPSSKDY